MSGNDPFDPFGENERTIIRPNPGGRAPQQPQQPQQQPQQPHNPNQPGYTPPPPRADHHQAQDFMQPMPGGAQQANWGPGGQPQQQPQWGAQQGGAAPAMGQPAGPTGLTHAPHRNPLVVAAGPLLDLLGRLKNAMTQASFTALQSSIAREIDNFEAAATQAGAYQNHLRDAKYALCAMADDIVQNQPGEDRAVWTEDPMLGRYFGERIGGTQFFANLQEAMKNPGANYDLLELYYTCLSLGFEGMHRASPTGQAAVQACRNDVYQALRNTQRGGGWLLSPNWKGMEIGRRSVGMQIPFWAVAALAAMLMTGAFFALRFLLGEHANELSAEIREVHPAGAIEISSPVRPVKVGETPVVTEVVRTKYEAPPPDDPRQLERIRAALKAEIDQGLVEARYLDANFIIVRFSNKLLFPSGSAEVTSAFKNNLAKRIGQTFQEETDFLKVRNERHGRVFAVGHSDAQPIGATSRWSSNHELSEARAKSVMDAVVAHSPLDLRTRIEGRGPDDPVCTPAGDRSCWAQNRRVELLIERTK